MNEFHLKSPLWLGDRKTMHVGIARFRLVDDMGNQRRGTSVSGLIIRYRIRMTP
jgi:hypothetical protein